MAARPDTWMPMYWGDYLRDTTHLSICQHGAYLLLIGWYWVRGRPLPDDDRQLARIARMSADEWSEDAPIIRDFFQPDTHSEYGAILRHKRIDAEIEKATRLSKARQKAGKKGGKAKAERVASDIANSVATAQQNPTPSPSPSHSYSEANASGAAAPSADLLEIPLALHRPVNDDWSKALFGPGLAWLAATLEKPPASVRSAVGRLLQLAGQDHKAVFDLLARAQREKVADPLAWAMRALQPEPSAADELTKAMAEMR